MNLLERRLKRAAKAELRNPARVPKLLELTTNMDWRLKPMASIQKQKLNTTQIMIQELYEYCNCYITIAEESKIDSKRLLKFIRGELEAVEWEYNNMLILRCRYMSEEMKAEPMYEHEIESYADIRGV